MAAACGDHRQVDVVGLALVQADLVDVTFHSADLRGKHGRLFMVHIMVHIMAARQARQQAENQDILLTVPSSPPTHTPTRCGASRLSKVSSPSWPWKPRPQLYMAYSGAGSSGWHSRATVWYVPSAMAVPCAAALDCPVTKFSSVT